MTGILIRGGETDTSREGMPSDYRGRDWDYAPQARDNWCCQNLEEVSKIFH